MWGGLHVKFCAAQSTSQKSGSTSRYEWEALEFQTLRRWRIWRRYGWCSINCWRWYLGSWDLCFRTEIGAYPRPRSLRAARFFQSILVGEWRKFTKGRGVKTFTGRLNCRWLHDGLCDRRRCGGAFIFASRLRTQTLLYGKSLVQARGKSIPSCRACGEGAETISHILKNRLSTT